MFNLFRRRPRVYPGHPVLAGSGYPVDWTEAELTLLRRIEGIEQDMWSKVPAYVHLPGDHKVNVVSLLLQLAGDECIPIKPGHDGDLPSPCPEPPYREV